MAKVLLYFSPGSSTLRVECTGLNFKVLSRIESRANQVMNDFGPVRSERSDIMTLTYALKGSHTHALANELLGQLGVLLSQLHVGELEKEQAENVCGYSWLDQP